MTVNNDKRILELKKQIEIKKEKLGKAARFNPVTNCNLTLDDVRMNINVLDKDQLTTLLIKLNSNRLSAEDLGILDGYSISGYHVQDWITDIKSRLDSQNRLEEEKALKVMESKLVKMLSEGKKIEMEIDDIESLLKD